MSDDNRSDPQTRTAATRIDWLLWSCGLITGAAYLAHWLFADAVSTVAWLRILTHSVFQLVNTVWWGVLMGIVMIGILGRVPREFVISALGTKQGAAGIVRATAAGVLLDLCSHGVLMVGVKLYERGVSTGQVMAFLVASPWNSFSLTFILIALVGVPWTVAFILMSMFIAIITGLIFDRLVREGVLPGNSQQCDLPPDFRFLSEARTRLRGFQPGLSFLTTTLLDGLKDSRMVVRWILFGVLLASLVRAFVAPEDFAMLFGPTLLGLGATLAAATVLEVCSEGSTPIAADMLTRAGAPGNSFAFLMGGVATDYTEILVLRDTTQSWRVALFLPLITLPQVILVAWLINRSLS